jgi:hypothetical protein
VIVIGAANRIYRYATRCLGGSASVMLPSERPKPGQSAKRRSFDVVELEQTIVGAG